MPPESAPEAVSCGVSIRLFYKMIFLIFNRKTAQNPIVLVWPGRGAKMTRQSASKEEAFIGEPIGIFFFESAHFTLEMPACRVTRPSWSNPTPFTGSVCGR